MEKQIITFNPIDIEGWTYFVLNLDSPVEYRGRIVAIDRIDPEWFDSILSSKYDVNLPPSIRKKARSYGNAWEEKGQIAFSSHNNVIKKYFVWEKHNAKNGLITSNECNGNPTFEVSVLNAREWIEKLLLRLNAELDRVADKSGNWVRFDPPKGIYLIYTFYTPHPNGLPGWPLGFSSYSVTPLQASNVVKSVRLMEENGVNALPLIEEQGLTSARTAIALLIALRLEKEGVYGANTVLDFLYQNWLLYNNCLERDKQNFFSLDKKLGGLDGGELLICWEVVEIRQQYYFILKNSEETLRFDGKIIAIDRLKAHWLPIDFQYASHPNRSTPETLTGEIPKECRKDKPHSVWLKKKNETIAGQIYSNYDSGFYCFIWEGRDGNEDTFRASDLPVGTVIETRLHSRTITDQLSSLNSRLPTIGGMFEPLGRFQPPGTEFLIYAAKLPTGFKSTAITDAYARDGMSAVSILNLEGIDGTDKIAKLVSKETASALTVFREMRASGLQTFKEIEMHLVKNKFLYNNQISGEQ